MFLRIVWIGCVYPAASDVSNISKYEKSPVLDELNSGGSDIYLKHQRDRKHTAILKGVFLRYTFDIIRASKHVGKFSCSETVTMSIQVTLCIRFSYA